jgi:hypothetical protein
MTCLVSLAGLPCANASNATDKALKRFMLLADDSER